MRGKATRTALRTVRQAKRAALRDVRTAPTKDASERASAAWYRLDDTGRRFKGKPSRTGVPW